ncbi:MAG TPA: c-type cytochrome [Terracidiphilus sp.]|jgi:cytochrome c2
MNARFGIAGLAWIAFCVAMAGCNDGKTTREVSVANLGNSEHGRQLISNYGCGACHMIPGVRGARGKVGPPLLNLSQRTMIAGELPNTPPNLTRWIQHPREVEPKTAMPELGVTQDEANDIAAYLYTLRGREGTSWID